MLALQPGALSVYRVGNMRPFRLTNSNMVKFVSDHDKNWVITISSLSRIMERLPADCSYGRLEAVSAIRKELGWVGPEAKESLVTLFNYRRKAHLPLGPNFGREDDIDQVANKLQDALSTSPALQFSRSMVHPTLERPSSSPTTSRRTETSMTISSTWMGQQILHYGGRCRSRPADLIRIGQLPS